jgi:hypothetical protein
MKAILTDAVAVGNAAARSIDFRGRDPAAKIYPDKYWNTPFIGDSYQWLTKGGARNFDARTMFFYVATVNTPAMAVAMPGIGSQYAAANVDSKGEPFDGGKTYRVRHFPYGCGLVGARQSLQHIAEPSRRGLYFRPLKMIEARRETPSCYESCRFQRSENEGVST